MEKFVCIIALLSLCLSQSIAQNTLRGKVQDEQTKEALVAVNVLIEGSNKGTVTDLEGNFELNIGDVDRVDILISYVGYEQKKITFTVPFNENVTINLRPAIIPGQEVVVTASRVSESLMEAPLEIQKMNTSDIKTSASGDFYESMGSLKGVDMIMASEGFKVFNTRGFNTTAPVRIVQFVDGVDNQAPGLNFPVGNLVGAPDIDLESVEIISGPASALYGPNAFQGAISMKTKNPFDYQGVSAQVKGGNRGYYDIQARYAQAFGEKEKFAVKLTAGYMEIDDWEANDSVANRYGDIETTQDLTKILYELAEDETIDPEDRETYIKLTTGYLDFAPEAAPGKKEIHAPGYDEVEIADYRTKSLKIAAAAHYKINDNLEASYNYKFGRGTGIYQGSNRYSINNITFQQHQLELSGKYFTIRGYTTKENAGDSYDMVFTANNLSRQGVPEWIGEYLSTYFEQLDTLTDFDPDETDIEDVEYADSVARVAADGAWFQPGTHEFDSIYQATINNPDLQEGSKFVDESSLQHIDLQFNPLAWKGELWTKEIDILMGGSFRMYQPRSFGTIFRDTLVNPADTLENGNPDTDAEFVNLNTYEFGMFTQISREFFDDHLKLIGSIRYDKHQNFNGQWSPKGSILFNWNQHNFRLSGQSAFRAPTLQDQYIQLDLGPIKLLGNINGFENLYTWESVQDFNAMKDSTKPNSAGVEEYVGEIDPSLLDSITLQPVQPEQVRTIELGYRGVFYKKLYIDATVYYNWYKNFIGDIRVVRPLGDGKAGEQSGEDAIITEEYELYQIKVNAKETVRSWGFLLGLSYYFGKGYSASANYTYADINTDDLTDPIIPGFNTPKHKMNLGVQGKMIWKGLGFNVNWKWVDDYFWESSFGDGQVESFNILDAQLNYQLPDYYLTFSVGGSNLTNQKYRTSYGTPLIGTRVYASVLFDMNFKR
ncbi:MAG: TonB-dependent receptor [Chitinophagales bacterium]